MADAEPKNSIQVIGRMSSLLDELSLHAEPVGLKALALALHSPSGMARAIVLDFSAGGAARGEQQWRALCVLANAVRDTLQLPAPAVSISGHGFQLWLSLAEPAPAAVPRLIPRLKPSGFRVVFKAATIRLTRVQTSADSWAEREEGSSTSR